AGGTRWRLTTVSVIVTVAPPAKSAPAGIWTPPPAAKTPSWPVNGVEIGLDRVTPPVIVTPSIVTVGSFAAPKVPIVSTGPPPLIVVRPDPAPTSLTLLSIVNPPSYVPALIEIVSPFFAAASAGGV